MTGASSAFVDKGSIMKCTALRSLIQFMQQNNVVEVVRDTAFPGFYCHLLLIPKKSGGWRPVIDVSFFNFFQVTPNSGSVSQNQSINSLIPAQPRRMCSYVADSAQSLCVHKKLVPLGWLHTAKPNIASLNIGISMHQPATCG